MQIGVDDLQSLEEYFQYKFKYKQVESTQFSLW